VSPLPPLFWVRQCLLFVLVSDCSAFAGEGFALPFARSIPPIGIELALLFKHSVPFGCDCNVGLTYAVDTGGHKLYWLSSPFHAPVCMVWTLAPQIKNSLLNMALER